MLKKVPGAAYHMIKMYEKMGFEDRGIADSAWGGEEWHEMSYEIGR